MEKSTNLVPLRTAPAPADTRRYERSARVAIGVAWAIAVLRLGIAIGRREQDLDSLLALLFVASLPAWAVLRAGSRRRSPPPSSGKGATVVPLRPRPGHRPPTHGGSVRRRAS